MDLIELAVREINLNYEFSTSKQGWEFGFNLGKNQVIISDSINRTFQSFTQKNITTTILYKSYLEHVTALRPITIYWGGQVRPRFTLSTETGYFESYLEVHDQKARNSLITSIPVELVAGLKSLVKSTGLSIDGRFFTGIDLYSIFIPGDNRFFTAGLGLLIGYQW